MTTKSPKYTKELMEDVGKHPDWRERTSLKALTLRVKGLDYEDIGDQLGITRAVAYELVWERIKDVHTTEMWQFFWVLENERLNRMLSEMEKHRDKDGRLKVNAANTILKVMDQRAKLLGLNAPERHVVTSEDEVTPAKVREAFSKHFGNKYVEPEKPAVH